MKVYSWGSSSNDQLGLGLLDDNKALSPQELTCFRNRGVRQIACGLRHTLFVLDDGTVYSCGSNDQGQLGHDKQNITPEQVKALETFSVIQAACGEAHNVVVNNRGQVLSWGCDFEGQCGQGTVGSQSKPKNKPRVIKSLSSHFVVQVACGAKHTLVLTKVGKLLSWGDNSNGQLGYPSNCCSPQPIELLCLNGLPFRQISCGGKHSFALTISGTIFGWGCNQSGQLGLNDKKDRSAPTNLKSLRSQQVQYIACGESHTAMLTSNGGVFTFGNGTHGQLGHNANTAEINPKKVLELMGSTVTQVACGRLHTLAFVCSSGRMYSFGLADMGQLGLNSLNPRNSPMTVTGPWVPHGQEHTIVDADVGEGMVIWSIYSGGFHCFCVASESQLILEPVDYRVPRPESTIYQFDEEFVKNLATLPNDSPVPTNIVKSIKEVFSSQACINSSFLTNDNKHYCSSRQNHGVDLDRAREVLQKLDDKHIVLSLISEVIHTKLAPTLSPSPPDIEALRLYLLLMECPTMQYPELYLESILMFGEALWNLSSAGAKVIDTWWGHFQPRHMNRILTIYKKTAVFLFKNQPIQLIRERGLGTSMKVLEKLQKVNVSRMEIVPYYLFYIPEITGEEVLRQHYIMWLKQQHGLNQMFTFCNYPFIFDGNAKTIILHLDATLQMQFALENVQRQNFQNYLMPTIDFVNPCLVLYIRRDNILPSTLDQLSKQGQTDFKKPLRVVFMGEEAMDAGGVRKEFFLLIFKEILDPNFGMFKYYKNTRTIWFNSKSFEDRSMFNLVGILGGLAIYNHTIIDLPFTLALYKKLLQRPVNLEDLKQLDPTLATSMEYLLDYDDFDLQDVFDLDFQISEEAFGEVNTVELIAGGKDIQVTIHNKQEYVDRYIDYVFNISVEEQYSAFAKGFLQVCGGSVLQLFHPQELMAMVVGNEICDWEEFERLVEYKDIYNKQHDTIKFFWEVFYELNLEQKKKFLVFLTGSDRIPVQGMSQLKVVIQPVYGSTDLLPAAHTCFNLLDLPLYENKEKMREKLLMTLENAQGFGLV